MKQISAESMFVESAHFENNSSVDHSKSTLMQVSSAMDLPHMGERRHVATCPGVKTVAEASARRKGEDEEERACSTSGKSVAVGFISSTSNRDQEYNEGAEAAAAASRKRNGAQPTPKRTSLPQEGPESLGKRGRAATSQGPAKGSLDVETKRGIPPK